MTMEMEKNPINVSSLAVIKEKGEGNVNNKNFILLISEKYEPAPSEVRILLHNKFENAKERKDISQRIKI